MTLKPLYQCGTFFLRVAEFSFLIIRYLTNFKREPELLQSNSERLFARYCRPEHLEWIIRQRKKTHQEHTFSSAWGDVNAELSQHHARFENFESGQKEKKSATGAIALIQQRATRGSALILNVTQKDANASWCQTQIMIFTESIQMSYRWSRRGKGMLRYLKIHYTDSRPDSGLSAVIALQLK